jgi:NDP-sugar pyrophosphorylase family protein
MKVVVLWGGTLLREETEFRPKPPVDIGGRPILWRIMKIYAHHGLREFVPGRRWMHFGARTLERLASEEQLPAYRYDTFFFSMDTYCEYQFLNELWASERAPWKVWP